MKHGCRILEDNFQDSDSNHSHAYAMTNFLSKSNQQRRRGPVGGCTRSQHASCSMQKFGLILFLVVVIFSNIDASHLLSVEKANKLQLVNNPDVSVFSPSSETRQPRRMHSTVVNELIGRITSALSSVSGDDQAVPMIDSHVTPASAGKSARFVMSTAQLDGVQTHSTTTAAPVTTTEVTESDTSEEQQEEEEDDCKKLFARSETLEEGQSLPEILSGGSKRNMTDNERLVALQNCIQLRVKKRLKETTRSSMELFEKVSLSGGCTSSLMGLMAGLSETKSFAFKFLDASAKIPSGVMYGLLSDFGDFDQCLSIRSNPHISPMIEETEGAFSGKYCLLNIRLSYHVQLGPNGSAPEGIIEDGVLWDSLIRNYWTSNSNKGFQIGVCVPSRCTSEDLDQLYRVIAESYNVLGEVQSCQDSKDLSRQATPDAIQLIILCLFFILILLNIIGSLVERYLSASEESLLYKMLVCFSLRRNWAMFMRQDAYMELAFNYDKSPSDNQSTEMVNQAQRFAGCDLIGSIVSSKVYKAHTSVENTITSSSSLNASISSAKLEDGQLNLETKPENQALTIKLSPFKASPRAAVEFPRNNLDCLTDKSNDLLSHLSGFKIIVIVWITIGHSFLYPSANNYQYYRSIINMNITRDSVWFATTNFTLGIDMLLYMTGLVLVYKVSHIRSMLTPSVASSSPTPSKGAEEQPSVLSSQHLSHYSLLGIEQEFIKKILRLWPTYLTVIAIAIVIPLLGDGPMWPEMVSRRLGDSCRKNWWANLLIMNNIFAQDEICLPSSWFVSILMQLFLVGSVIMLVIRNLSIALGLSLIGLLLVSSSAISFAAAYYNEIKAPVIRMDESFVLELDDNIYRLYTNLFNNMGPFLIGMIGGFILLRWQARQVRKAQPLEWQQMVKLGPSYTDNYCPENGQDIIRQNEKNVCGTKDKLRKILQQVIMGCVVCCIAVLVLSSVFHTEYSTLWSAVYWSCHRVGWAIVTGYVIHQCAIGRWKLLKDLCSLSHLIPFSRLIFIAYLVYPIFIHLHSGLVRDGLHVSVYNMINIYTTRLVLTFILALCIHLLVELPFCSIEAILLSLWIDGRQKFASPPKSHATSEYSEDKEEKTNGRSQPLLISEKLEETNDEQ